MEYVIPDENIRKEFAEFIKENPDKKYASCAKWTIEDFNATKKIFDQDVEFVRNLLNHQTLPTYNINQND